MPNYWIVGANWSGVDKKEEFYKLGFWEMGWEDHVQPKYAAKRDKIKEGDRIAIKTMDGKGQRTITIHAIGIVKGIDAGKIFINWVVTGMDRKVYSHGCLGTIHGPYEFQNAWTTKVFCI